MDILQEEKTYTLKELKEMAEVLKHDTNPANALGTNVAHGLEAAGHPFAGLWSTSGPRPDMWSTLTRMTTLASMLVKGETAREQRSEFEVFTGITAGSGTNAVNMCDPAPKAGVPKGCIQRAYFGRIRLDTDTNELPTLGGYVNYADYDRNVLNLVLQQNKFVPDVLSRATNPNSQEFMQLFTMGIQLERVVEQVLFQGVNTVADGASTFLGFSREFDGFDTLIGVGKVDARSNVACPGVDSLISSWGSALIDASIFGPNSVTYNFVQVLTEMWYVLNQRSDEMGMSPTQWIMVMHPDMFRAVTRVWGCQYITNNCNQASDGTPLNMDAASQKRMTDEMFNGNFLWMDGQRVPVVLSRGMANTQVGNGFRGDIYFIPLQSLGIQTTFIEFFDQGNPVITGFNSLAGDTAGYRTLNNGQFAIANSRTRFCLQYHLAAQPRLIMRTPWLAARLTNVVYRNFLYTNDPIPGNAYHLDGGQTQRYSPTLF
jgi:hypothetical protein